MRDITEPDWPNLPHYAMIESYYPLTGKSKSLRKTFDTEAQAIEWARTVVPDELRPTAEECRYDEVTWSSCHFEWCVSVGLDMPSIVQPWTPTKSIGERIKGRLAYWRAAIADKIAPELPAGHPEFASNLDRRDAEAHGH